MEIDTILEASAGSPGVVQRRTRVRLENGDEVSRAPDGEVVTVAPINHVIRYGTAIVMRVIDTEQGPVEYWRKVTMRVTSYTAATSGKAPGDPGYGITASGCWRASASWPSTRPLCPSAATSLCPATASAFAGDWAAASGSSSTGV
jgi:hypothetical protein